MAALTQVTAWLNTVANALGRIFLAPIGSMPGWLSATIIAAVTGLIMLVAFKYTSNQNAIKQVRNDIKASLFSLKLFKDNTSAVLAAQGKLFASAFWLLVYALVPMLVMLVPVLLILGQLALWYDLRPLHEGDTAIVTLTLNGEQDASWPKVELASTPAAAIVAGPVHVERASVRNPPPKRMVAHHDPVEVSEPQSKTNVTPATKPDNKERAAPSAPMIVGDSPMEEAPPTYTEVPRAVWWQIKAEKPGYHSLVFNVDGKPVEKQLAIGDGLMRVSAKRPDWSFEDVLVNPEEAPFRPDSPVRSIEINKYRLDTSSWTTGTGTAWIVYWFAASMVAALIFRKWLNVNI